MAGYLIYNGFWNSEGPPDVIRRLQKAGEALGVSLTPVPNNALTVDFVDGSIAVRRSFGGRKDALNAADFALFWDKDVRLARAMEAIGMRLYNPADGVALCDDKAATHLALAKQGIPMPRTLVAPMTYLHMDAGPSEAFYRLAEQQLGYPLVVKECFGSLGGQVYLVQDGEQLRRLADGFAARPFLLQAYIPPGGQDFRLYMVGGRLAAAMQRVNAADFRANIGSGGHGQVYTPTPEEIALAEAACRILQVPIAGVDILHTPDGRPLVCEVNSGAQLAEITACTGVDVAREIVAFVLRCEQDGGIR